MPHECACPCRCWSTWTCCCRACFDALSAPSDRVVAEALSVQAAIAQDDPAQFRTIMRELLGPVRADGPLCKVFKSLHVISFWSASLAPTPQPCS